MENHPCSSVFQEKLRANATSTNSTNSTSVETIIDGIKKDCKKKAITGLVVAFAVFGCISIVAIIIIVKSCQARRKQMAL